MLTLISPTKHFLSSKIFLSSLSSIELTMEASITKLSSATSPWPERWPHIVPWSWTRPWTKHLEPWGPKIKLLLNLGWQGVEWEWVLSCILCPNVKQGLVSEIFRAVDRLCQRPAFAILVLAILFNTVIVQFDPCTVNIDQLKEYEPHHDKTNKMECASSEDSDQPGHPPSLIRVFAVPMKKHWVLRYLFGTHAILLVLSGDGSHLSCLMRKETSALCDLRHFNRLCASNEPTQPPTRIRDMALWLKLPLVPYMSLVMRKPFFWVSANKYDSNRSAQLQRLARDLKFSL